LRLNPAPWHSPPRRNAGFCRQAKLLNGAPRQVVRLQNLDLGAEKILVRLYLLIDLVQHLDRRSIGLNLNARSGFINRLGLERLEGHQRGDDHYDGKNSPAAAQQNLTIACQRNRSILDYRLRVGTRRLRSVPNLGNCGIERNDLLIV